MNRITLPNGLDVAIVNAGEAHSLYAEIFVERCYLPPWLALQPGDVILDVGANIGLASLFFHYEVPGLRIVAIEPASLTNTALRDNLARHRVSGAAHRCALSDRSRLGSLTFYPETTAMSGLDAAADEDEKLSAAYLANGGASREDAAFILQGKFRAIVEECEVRTLSDILAEERIERVDLLKIDVEKSEIEVLNGIAEPDWALIDAIVLEAHDIDGRVEVIVQMLEEHDFASCVEQVPLLAGTNVFTVGAWRRGAKGR